MPETVYDRDGSQISLTEERWEYIIEFHEEMQEYREHVSGSFNSRVVRDG